MIKKVLLISAALCFSAYTGMVKAQSPSPSPKPTTSIVKHFKVSLEQMNLYGQWITCPDGTVTLEYTDVDTGKWVKLTRSVQGWDTNRDGKKDAWYAYFGGIDLSKMDFGQDGGIAIFTGQRGKYLSGSKYVHNIGQLLALTTDYLRPREPVGQDWFIIRIEK